MKNLLKIMAPVLVLALLLFAGCDWGSTPTYTVTYDANGADSGSVPIDSTAYLEDETVTVLGNTGSLVRTGYTHAGWNAATDGSGDSYTAGQTFAMSAADVVLYATWTENVPSWTVLFEDDFNRTDTTGRDLGSDWTVTGTGADEMYISSNEVYSSYLESAVGVIATYDGSVDYTEKVRVSVKFKIDYLSEWPAQIGGLALSLNTTSWAGYYCQVDYTDPNHVLMVAETDGTDIVDSATVTMSLVDNTWYFLELESDDTTVTARIANEAGTTLGTVTLTDDPRTYPTGAVGFFNFTVDEGYTPVGEDLYFDDFKLEAFR